MRRNLAVLGVWAFACTACNQSIGTLDGVTLDPPDAVVFHPAEDGRVMVVFSSLGAALCDALKDEVPPTTGEHWVMSMWTSAVAETGKTHNADGYVRMWKNAEASEYVTVDGQLKFNKLWYDADETSDITDGEVKGKVELEFKTGDRIQYRFEGTYCDADIFRGM